MQSSAPSNRRSFLKKLSLASASAWTLNFVQPGSVFGATASNKLNLALIGCGSRMRQLLPSIVADRDNIAALCDADANQIARLRSEGLAKAWARATLSEPLGWSALVISTRQKSLATTAMRSSSVATTTSANSLATRHRSTTR